MSMMETFKSDKYDDGRTKQSFKDATDINKILAKAGRGDTISHLAKHGAVYGDFTDYDDLLDAHTKLQRGQHIFDGLPGEIKREFNQNAGAFFNYVNDPANAERLPEVLPQLAKRGTQLPAIKRTPETIDTIEEQQAATPPPPAPPTPPTTPE